MTFEEYLKKKKIKLRPWQSTAAAVFLTVIHRHRQGSSGKTFLIRLLDDFLSEHGNDFEV